MAMPCTFWMNFMMMRKLGEAFLVGIALHRIASHRIALRRVLVWAGFFSALFLGCCS